MMYVVCLLVTSLVMRSFIVCYVTGEPQEAWDLALQACRDCLRLSRVHQIVVSTDCT